MDNVINDFVYKNTLAKLNLKVKIDVFKNIETQSKHV